jgi:hypothetical protein
MASRAKPGSLQAVSVIWIVDGILTILWGFSLVVAALSSLIGIICLPLTLYPFAVGIIELVYGIKLASASPSVSKPPYFVSIMEMLLLFWVDPIGFIAGLATLVLLNGADAKEFLASRES